MVLSASGVIALSRPAVRVLAEEEFFGAWQFVPILCLAMVFASFSTFSSSVYVVSKKSTLSFWTALLGAGINVLINLLLIPRIGILGAPVWMLGYLFVSGAAGRLRHDPGKADRNIRPDGCALRTTAGQNARSRSARRFFLQGY